jgi:hypothetical protein
MADPDERTKQKRDKYTPIWEIDADSTRCRLCPTEFGLMNRRHHCRTCGKLICASCSAFRVLKYDDNGEEKIKDKRLCKPCLDFFKNHKDVDVQQCKAAAISAGAAATKMARAASSRAVIQAGISACAAAKAVATRASDYTNELSIQASRRPAQAAMVLAALCSKLAAAEGLVAARMAVRQVPIAASVSAERMAKFAAQAAENAFSVAVAQPTKAAFVSAASVSIKAALFAAAFWIEANKQPSRAACTAAIATAKQATVRAIALSAFAAKQPAEAKLNFSFWASYLGTTMLIPTWKRRYVSSTANEMENPTSLPRKSCTHALSESSP